MNTTEYESEIRKQMVEERRCPVCVIVQNKEFDILSQLQYDVTQDASLRKAIARERGFCDFHFRQFKRIANSETNALLLLALVVEHCSRDLPGHRNCRICEELVPYEERILTELVALFASDSFREFYWRCSGLCLLHMRNVQDQMALPDVNSWLNEVQRQQLQRDVPALLEMSTRSFFATTHSQRGSIACMVEKFVGRKSIGL